MSQKVQDYYEKNVVNAKPGASATATVKQTVVSVLSDSHAYNQGSWFRQTVEAGNVPGAVLGVFASQPGASAEVLANRVRQAVSLDGVVIVQAGTNDLMSAVSPEDAAKNVEALVAGVKEGGNKPVLALIPPSDTRGDLVMETNALLKQYAAANKVGLLDVTAPVIAEDGTWKPGLTTDGVHANTQGAKLMAGAAAKQLPALIR